MSADVDHSQDLSYAHDVLQTGLFKSMPDSKKQKEQENVFLVTTNPYDASSAANKKRVRSVAALKSWPERRKKTFEQHDQSARQGGFVLDLNAGTGEPAAPKSKGKEKKKDPPQVVQPPSPISTELSEPRVQELDDDPLFEECTRASTGNCSCTHCRVEGRYRYGSSQGQSTQHVALPHGKKRMADGQLKFTRRDLAMLTPPSSPNPSPLALVNVGRMEPFNCYPVNHKPVHDLVLHHMLNIFAPRGWPALKISNAEGMHWEWFMTQHALSEPALWYVRLLFASGDLIRLGTLPREVSYWLQAEAIKAINEALTDPNRATSDALILAVGRIAMHESWYGDKHAANTMHRPAQARMIRMRGGMKALPYPDLVKRLMRWADTVMSKQSGTERMLDDEDEDKNFTIKEGVEVLEKWVPPEGKELRRKIKISDLLSTEPS